MAHFSPLRAILYFLIASCGLAADLYTKHAIFAQLGAPHGSTDWLINGWFRFRLFTTFNHGALWGVGQGMTWLFALLSIGAFFGILYWLFFGGAIRSTWFTVALGLISAGTLGNLWDRAGMHGLTTPDENPIFAVRDFLHCRFGSFDWAVFNLADVFLVVGAIMLGLHSLTPEPVEETETAKESEPVGSAS